MLSIKNTWGYLDLFLNLLDFLDQLRDERLYPMVSEETPQGAPDPVLMIQVEPILDQTIQRIHVGSCEGHAETLLNGFFRQRRVHLKYYLTAHKSLISFWVRASAFVVYLSHRNRVALALYLTDFLDQLRVERLYSMETEEEPQSGPDRHLVFHVDTLLDQLIQGFYVDPCEGQA